MMEAIKAAEGKRQMIRHIKDRMPGTGLVCNDV